MAHVPLALLPHKPQCFLAICFGMGTSHRSALAWDIQTTSVELVPSVVDVFDYYFKDAPEILNNPKSTIVIDDGRRFLQRTNQTFDVISIDPPPPIEAAGSSLLYSEEFYELVKKRLKPGGILQHWFPFGEKKILQAVTRSLYNSFNYIYVYKSTGGWGHHFSCSQSPFPFVDPDTLVQRIPDRARVDLMEWYRSKDVKELMHVLHQNRVPIESLLNPDEALVITDDHPFNEYFALRRTIDRIQNVYEVAR